MVSIRIPIWIQYDYNMDSGNIHANMNRINIFICMNNVSRISTHRIKRLNNPGSRPGREVIAQVGSGVMVMLMMMMVVMTMMIAMMMVMMVMRMAMVMLMMMTRTMVMTMRMTMVI